MPTVNNIALATIYKPVLDEVYKRESLTSDLEAGDDLVTKGAHDIKIPKIDMDGLGDFSRNSGYTQGSTTLAWETVAYDKERSQRLTIDRLDNEEALDVPFANLSAQFIKTKVAPETDAARIAKIATKAIEANNYAAEDLTASTVIASLSAAKVSMDNKEVPTESRILYITPALAQAIRDLDTIKSKEVLKSFSKIVEVPATRMNTAVALNTGETSYGFTPATGSHAINYLIVEKSAVVCAMDQYVKYFTPDQNQNGDGHLFMYRNNNLYAHVYENKADGVFVSYATAAAE